MSEPRPSPRGDVLPDLSAGLLAAALEERAGELAALWWQLGAHGPTCGSPQAGDEDFSRRRYLLPLARLLIGALRGGPMHQAGYLDERLRYLPSGLDAAGRAGFLARQLAIESEAVAAFAGNDVAPAITWRLLAVLHEPLTAAPLADPVRLLLIGDTLFNGTRAFLAQAERDAGRQLDVEHLPPGELTAAGLSMEHVLASIRHRPPHLIGLSLLSYEAVPPYAALLAQRLPLARSGVSELGRLLQDAIDTLRAATDAPILLHNACGLPLDRLRRRLRWLPAHDRSRMRVLRELNDLVAALAALADNILLVDEPGLVQAGGGLRACAAPVYPPQDVPAGVFCPARLEALLAAPYGAVLDAARILGPAKALLVDFDNTLWSGVMADGPVSHDRAAQKTLRRLRGAGVLLIALSKNAPQTIRWDEMELTPEDFVLHKFSWQPKAQTAAEAITELDLASGAFVLLDDNPAERAMVTGAIPEVTALDPAQPATWRMLESWLVLPSARRTPEALRRTEMYREAAARRQALAGGQDYAKLMAGLHMAADFRQARRGDLDRLAELVNRTSQFNTTTRRRSRSELSELLASASHSVYVASFRDRFGDLGLVAAVIIEHPGNGTAVFDSVIMSCRAMGFGLERLLVRRTLDAEPAQTYRGLITPTARNQPAAGLFRDMGFTETSGGVWELGRGARLAAVPEWLTG
ncbi:MAG: hypothetical protein ACR2MP_06955 [Streptosporangiaceae bacterium]